MCYEKQMGSLEDHSHYTAVKRQKNTHVNYYEFIKHLMIDCDMEFNM